MRRKNCCGATNKKLIIILCFLILVISCLIVSIILVNWRSKSSTPSINDCTIHEESYDIADCIKTNYEIDDSLENLLASYRVAITQSITEGKTYTAANLIASRANFFISLGQCDEALRLLDGEDLTSYDAQAKSYIYSKALDASTECGNEAAQSKWDTLLITNNQEIKNAIGT